MFKHILVPIDGSALSMRAAKRAIGFAKSERARITAFYATPEYHPAIGGDFIPANFVPLALFEKQVRKAADEYLGRIKQLAAAAGVPCAVLRADSDWPHLAIIKAANARKCDLIFMASHGRSGFSKLLLGSETSKVLAQCKLPVLVYR